MKTWCWAALFAALAFLAAEPPVFPQERPLYGLRYMAAFESLPEFKDAVCRQVSSYDRKGGNDDLGHFVNGDTGKLPDNRAVLADLKGPGCIYRIWSANAAGTLRFYFDGETEPRIACPMQDLFRDQYPPFRTPLAGQSSGGWYSYFPIPFAQSVRIEVENPGRMYYQVQYHQLPEGTPVRTFTRELTSEDRAALETVLGQWKNAPPAPAGVNERDGRADLKRGKTATLLREEQPGIIRSLRVRVEPATRFTLRNLVLRAYWDGAPTPAVEAPVGDFFGVGFGERKFRSAALAMAEQGYVCSFPMPFRQSARIEITNEGKQPVQVSWRTETGAMPANAANLALFHAKWRRVTTEEGKHITLLQTTGRGHFVGVNLNMQGHRGLWFLEGDEKIYVDGEEFPSIYGTGLEDYFTSGWYFITGPFALPYHGCLVKDEPNSRISAYRYQITDCVPFKESIRVDIEHGGTNDYPGADYAFTSYWYQDSPTDGWPALASIAGRRPAPVRTQNVVEAESLKPSGGRIVDDEELQVEASGGQVVAAGGKRVTLDVEVETDAYYTLTMGLVKTPEGGLAQVSVDGKPLSRVVDAYAATPAVERVDLGMTDRLSQGRHRLTVRILGKNLSSRGQGLLVDYIGMRKVLHPDALEGERLRITERTPGVPLEEQDLKGFGPHWSGDAHLWFRPTQPRAFFTLEVPVRSPGRYRLGVYFTRAIDYGQVQVSLDGKDVGPVFDGFHDGVVPSGRIDLGEVDLTAGNHALKFTVTGKNEKSTSYMVGVDAVVLEPVK
jgi:D-arabinan exo alpha-(1,3)/(1,5)-arabinofuranosidase (non-reducing end)